MPFLFRLDFGISRFSFFCMGHAEGAVFWGVF